MRITGIVTLRQSVMWNFILQYREFWESWLELWCKIFLIWNSWLEQTFVLGFIKALVTELWALLECGKDDLRITQPKSTPVDPIDQSCQKVRNYLILRFCLERNSAMVQIGWYIPICKFLLQLYLLLGTCQNWYNTLVKWWLIKDSCVAWQFTMPRINYEIMSNNHDKTKS